jgi:hypothetical protein
MTPSADQFRLIAEIGGDVAWIVDCATGLPSYISPAVEPLLGYGFADFHRQMKGGDPAGPLGALCADLAARLTRLAAGDLSRLQLVRQFDQQHRDGHQVPIEVVSTVKLDPAGRLPLIASMRSGERYSSSMPISRSTAFEIRR